MDAKIWAQVKEIFSHVVGFDDAERRAYLDQHCAGDAELRGEVEALLRSNDEVENFIEEPAFTVASALPNDAEPTVDKVIGHYRIVREIGRGGMGTVFLAKRDDGEFQQEVAIKVVSSAFLGRESLDRFRQERQILAGLTHPNIARLLDGGVTDDGLPYLVMEYVDGRSLIEHADDHNLSIDERLRVFLKICRGFAYAHGNLIVHRDIKPSNILVTPDGEPKLLDFGLAKILDIEKDYIRTASNFRALTPAYASPEQIRGDAITTASDIYSLGVVLYELLSGLRPFNYDSLTFEKMIEIASGSEPILPSVAVTRLNVDAAGRNENSTVIAPRRVSASDIKGDIDNIVLMAMRFEPVRRYRSVEQFANDIERHLDGLPISATEDTFAYRFSKFVRRNTVATVTATLVALAIIAGLIATTWQARVAARERDQAEREKVKAEQLNAFLQSMLAAASPNEKGKNAKVIDVLDDTARRIDIELANQPELKAKALSTVGKTYIELGQPETAEPKLREALRLYTELFSGGHKDKTICMMHLSGSLIDQYKFEEAEPIILEAIRTERSTGQAPSKDLSQALFILGELNVRKASFQEAETLLNEAIAICDGFGSETEFDCGYYRISLGRARYFSGDLDSAEMIFRQSLAVFQKQPSRYATRIADLSVNLGDVLISKSDFPAGIKILKEADDIYEAQLGDSLNLVISKFYLSRAYLGQNDNAQAAELAGRAIEIARRLGWVENRNFVLALRIMGLSLTRLGKAKAGEPYLRESSDRASKYLKADDPRIQDVASALGECLAAQRRNSEAEPLLSNSYEALRSRLGDHDPRTKEARERLVRYQESRTKKGRAQ